MKPFWVRREKEIFFCAAACLRHKWKFYLLINEKCSDAATQRLRFHCRRCMQLRHCILGNVLSIFIAFISVLDLPSEICFFVEVERCKLAMGLMRCELSWWHRRQMIHAASCQLCNYQLSQPILGGSLWSSIAMAFDGTSISYFLVVCVISLHCTGWWEIFVSSHEFLSQIAQPENNH